VNRLRPGNRGNPQTLLNELFVDRSDQTVAGLSVWKHRGSPTVAANNLRGRDLFPGEGVVHEINLGRQLQRSKKGRSTCEEEFGEKTKRKHVQIENNLDSERYQNNCLKR
jgi:hypothetical protein